MKQINVNVKPLLISLILPLIILIVRPFALETGQAALLGGIIMIITWWSFGAVKKDIASLALIGIFLLFGIPLKTVFTFPLSDNFLMITVCYLFSRGIEKAEILPKLFGPLLYRHVNTPFKAVLAAIAVLLIGIWCIPQSLVRLIMTVVLFNNFLKETDASEDVKTVIRFSVFVFYAAVNMVFLNADIILNTAAVGFAGLPINSMSWLMAMGVPGCVNVLATVALFAMIFRKQIHGITFHVNTQKTNGAFTSSQKRALAILVLVILLWATESLHGLKASWAAVIGTVLLFCNKDLELHDYTAIDISTLLFLTAAFSIGGTMVASGIAAKVFGAISLFFPKEYTLLYAIMTALVAMGMHMLLGSNTTTLSIVLPGLMSICAGTAPLTQVFFTAYFVIASQYILPFHSVAMMIGTSDKQFPESYVRRFGLPLILVSCLVLVLVCLPWWQLIQLI